VHHPPTAQTTNHRNDVDNVDSDTVDDTCAASAGRDDDGSVSFELNYVAKAMSD
jgi:hypothetical protein